MPGLETEFTPALTGGAEAVRRAVEQHRPAIEALKRRAAEAVASDKALLESITDPWLRWSAENGGKPYDQRSPPPPGKPGMGYGDFYGGLMMLPVALIVAPLVGSVIALVVLCVIRFFG